MCGVTNETGQGPFADALHGGPNGDGLRWDYKRAEAGGNPRTQVQNAIRKGKKPSGNIVVRFEDGADVDLEELNRGVNAALTHDANRKQPLVQQIVVLYETSESIVEEQKTTEEYRDGEVFQGP